MLAWILDTISNIVEFLNDANFFYRYTRQYDEEQIVIQTKKLRGFFWMKIADSGQIFSLLGAGANCFIPGFSSDSGSTTNAN